MAVTSDVYVSVVTTGDVELNQTFSAAQNLTAPGDVDLVALSTGFNSIPVPTTAKGAVIIPITPNTQTLTLKGVTGDTGILLSKINPSLISFDIAPPATIGITAGGAASVRIVWT